MSDEENSTEVSAEDLKEQLQKTQQLADDYKKQFEAVKSKADELLDETKKAKAKAREEGEAKERAELDKAKKNGDFEQLLQSSEKERAALAEQLSSLHNKVSSERTRSESLRIAGELADGANAELLSEFISKRIKYTDDGLKVLNQSGELTVSTLDDLKREFESSDKFKSLLRGNQSSGGGAVGDGGSASGQAKIKRSQFDSMMPKDKMAFVKNGGSIID